MPRFPVPLITVLALVAVSLASPGCSKRLATAEAPARAPGAMTTPSPDDTTAGTPSTGTAPNPEAAQTATPSSAGRPGAAPGASADPSATRPNPREFEAVADVRDIHFDFDRYDIRPDAAKILDANARWMKANPAALVLIEGHTDEQGTNEYNLALGERRAKAAMNYLVGQGLPAERFTVISYGEEWPQCRERNDACWARNRRAHFLAKPRNPSGAEPRGSGSGGSR
jgi:peptidoglycan-associated lipoprotein